MNNIYLDGNYTLQNTENVENYAKINMSLCMKFMKRLYKEENEKDTSLNLTS